MRKLPKTKFLAAFLLTIIVFFLIIITNNYFNESRLKQLNSIYNEIRIDALSAEIQYEIISENPCIGLNFNPMNDELFELGEKLTLMEDDLGKKNKQVIDLKKYYSILEIRQYLFVKKISEQCNKSAVPILFFYSNEEDCSDCESQGFVLNYIKKIREDVHIYSFDVNLDSSAIDALKLTHGVTEVPSLVIKDKKAAGFKTSDEVLEILKNK